MITSEESWRGIQSWNEGTFYLMAVRCQQEAMHGPLSAKSLEPGHHSQRTAQAHLPAPCIVDTASMLMIA